MKIKICASGHLSGGIVVGRGLEQQKGGDGHFVGGDEGGNSSWSRSAEDPVGRSCSSEGTLVVRVWPRDVPRTRFSGK